MIATIYTGLGDKDKAFSFLEKAYQERSPDIPYFLKADLRLDPLRLILASTTLCNASA